MYYPNHHHLQLCNCTIGRMSLSWWSSLGKSLYNDSDGEVEELTPGEGRYLTSSMSNLRCETDNWLQCDKKNPSNMESGRAVAGFLSLFFLYHKWRLVPASSSDSSEQDWQGARVRSSREGGRMGRRSRESLESGMNIYSNDLIGVSQLDTVYGVIRCINL